MKVLLSIQYAYDHDIQYEKNKAFMHYGTRIPALLYLHVLSANHCQ